MSCQCLSMKHAPHHAELYLHGPTPLVKLCLKRTQQASTAHFQLLMQAGKPVEVELDEQRK